MVEYNYYIGLVDTLNPLFDGVDMVGLLKIVGDKTMVEIFEELFDITVDGKVENFNLFEKVDVAFFAE